MIRTAPLRLLPVVLSAFLLSALMAARAYGQDAADSLPDPNQNPLEFVKQLAKSDADTKFKMLPAVTPRGASQADRQEMVRLLADDLDNTYPDVRARAATALGLFKQDASPAIPKLLQLIGDQEKTVGYRPVWNLASEALSNIGRPSLQPVLDKIPTAADNEYNGLLAVVSELGDEPEAQAAAPMLIETLRNGPKTKRWSCMFCLSKLGAAAEPAIPEFIKNLDEPSNFNVQVAACRALAEHGKKSVAAVPRLIDLAEKKRENVLSARTHAVMALGAIGPTKETDEGYQELVDIFKSMISEPNAFCQERGLIAMGRLGAKASSAQPFIADLLEKEDFSQRPEAALAMWKVSGQAEPSLEILRSLVDQQTYQSRVIDSLKEMGPAASPMAEGLAERMEQTDDSSLQLMLAEVLVAMGQPGVPYIEKIKEYADAAPPEIAIELDDIAAELERIRASLSVKSSVPSSWHASAVVLPPVVNCTVAPRCQTTPRRNVCRPFRWRLFRLGCR